MKRFVLLLIVLVLCFSAYGFSVNALGISAESAVLYCADNKKVYFSKNENKRVRPASTTKIMTALLTLEYAARNNKAVEFTEKMMSEGSSMYLEPGEVLTLRDLAVGILLCSGNDAANAAAISISGSKEKFAALMTKRARKIGMNNTNFVTVNGLDDDNHYTTAYDMALLMAEALKNQDFKSITARKTDTVKFIKPDNKITSYSNHNRLLSTYEYCIGGKTGYTMSAGRCLVSAAVKDGLTLIAVTMNDKRDWADHTAMYNYGFENYRMKELDDNNFFLDVDTVGGEKTKTTVGGVGNSRFVLKPSDYNKVKRTILMDNFLYAPLKENSEVGEIIYTLNGKRIARHSITVVENNSSKKENKSIFEIIEGFFKCVLNL